MFLRLDAFQSKVNVAVEDILQFSLICLVIITFKS